jgi:Pectate lyase superfamily protein
MTLTTQKVKQSGTGATNRGVIDKLNDVVSVKDFGAVGNGIADDTTAIQNAINLARSVGGTVMVPPGTYLISNSLNIGDETASYNGVRFIGQGLPTIQSNNLTSPIIKVGGERMEISGVLLNYTLTPTSGQTNAVAIRCYNLYESIISRVYILSVNRGIDQYQGLVLGSQNSFYSNRLQDLRIIQFSTWAINLTPYSGGNSGNRFDNIYISNNNGATPTSNNACNGGIYMATSSDGVFNQINVEWCKNSSSLIVLNQCGNPVWSGIHLEGNYPQTSFQPLIDINGGDGSTPHFDGLTLDSTDFSAVSSVALFRIDSNGTKLRADGIKTLHNTSISNSLLLTNSGSTCYGSIAEFNGCRDLDGAISYDDYTPKVSVGAVTLLTEYPIQRYNGTIHRHHATVTDDAGGTLSSVSSMVGTVSNYYQDPQGLWDVAGSNRFDIKVSGNYLCIVNIPTGSSPVVSIKKNFGVTPFAQFSVTPGGGSLCALITCARNDNIEFVLSSGSYTRTGVTFGIALMG